MSNSEFKSTLKSSDTEEHIDIYFYRPIGYQWARFFRMLHVTPNVVTILSIFLGVGAGICFGFNDLRINIVGILLLIWANMYDSCDGQLARLTNQKSALGRILDGAAGDFWFIAIYVAICIRLMPEWGVWIWVLCVVSGFVLHQWLTPVSSCRLLSSDSPLLPQGQGRQRDGRRLKAGRAVSRDEVGQAAAAETLPVLLCQLYSSAGEGDTVVSETQGCNTCQISRPVARKPAQ